MEPIHVAAALASALLHASWNAAVKAHPSPSSTMTAQMVLSSLLMLPGLLVFGLPASASWPWIAGSTAMNLIAVSSMLRAYEHGGFGLVYPVMRATGVLCVVPLAALIAGERLTGGGLIGVVIIALALSALAVDAGRDRTVGPRAIGWTLVAGLAGALSILCDAQGARAAGSAIAYGCVTPTTNAIAMSLYRRREGAPWTFIAQTWRVALPAAMVAAVSYLLILWVWGDGAPIAPAAALRDTSAVFAILIAVFILRERFTALRIAAVLLAAIAIPLLRLG